MALRILVVDDDEPTLQICSDFFHRHAAAGASVDLARSGEEAIARIDAAPPDILLTDFRMGAVSGIEVLRRAHERNPRGARVLMSSYADDHVARAARAAGAHDILEKPLRRADFDAALLRLLARHLGRP